MNIIALDIDDCIFPNDNTYAGRSNDALEILEINLKRLQLILNKYNAYIFITSSWYSILEYKNNKLYYNNFSALKTDKEYYQQEYGAFLLLKKYISHFIVGMSCGNRFKDIDKLLEENHTVVALDDMDLSTIEHDNYLYVPTYGFITNHLIYDIHKFLKDKID